MAVSTSTTTTTSTRVTGTTASPPSKFPLEIRVGAGLLRRQWNGSGLGERHGQLAEDGQVGVQPDPIQSTGEGVGTLPSVTPGTALSPGLSSFASLS